MIHELYDGEVQVKFSEASHRYKVLKPSRYAGPKQGVTTPLNVLSKDMLVPWAAGKAVDTFRDAYKQLPTMSKEEFNELCKKAKNAHRLFKEDAADVGTRVHSWVENHIKGNDLPTDADMQPSVDAFLKWEETHQPVYEFSERVVYSKEYDYCGTVDIGAKIGSQTLRIDLKTGKPDKEYNSYRKTYTGRQKARSTHYMQNAGYDQAIIEEDGVAADAYGVLYLPLDGSLFYYTSPHTKFWRDAFIQVLKTSRIVKTADKEINKYEEV